MENKKPASEREETDALARAFYEAVSEYRANPSAEAKRLAAELGREYGVALHREVLMLRKAAETGVKAVQERLNERLEQLDVLTAEREVLGLI